MHPYNVKFRSKNGFVVIMQCDSIEEGQRLALRHGASCYTIK
ncbi:hypothetical protein MNBD_ALPHA03-1262, partial [hydrothermal vent metagenome]